MKQKLKLLAGSLVIVGVLGAVRLQPVHAATTIVVNSKADTTNNDGSCTLREAIIAANTDTASGLAAGECAAGSGVDTITFAITGTADFTNGGQSGYTILPLSGLPDITEQVTINGYTQPNARANTATAPNPLNGRLLVEVKGTSAGNAHAFQFTNNSDNSQIKGLVINDFSQGDGVEVLADGIKIQGNYIGTDPAGAVAHPNIVGVNAYLQNPASGHNALVGGLSPADRNIISGNTAGTTGTGGYPGTGWVIQGNYVGVGADGLTPINNSIPNGSGAFSIDNCTDVLIGGSQPGAINVIGASLGHGLAPDNVDNLVIDGNYIGFGYDGTTIIGTLSGGGEGIAVSNVTNAEIKNNRIAGWSNGGISLNSGTNANISVANNIVHDNQKGGVYVYSGTNITVSGNRVYNNPIGNINVIGASAFGSVVNNVKISSNIVGFLPNGAPALSNTTGISILGDPSNVLIGGVLPGQGNIVGASRGAGVSIASLTASAFNATLNVEKVSVLGNSIYGTSPATSGPLSASGLGIDLMGAVDTDSPPDGVANTYTNAGPTLNDLSDIDTGSNNYMNFPVVNSFVQNGNQATANFNLDAADSPVGQYRIEFYANDAADTSGYGEGQTYLGSTVSNNGTNLQAAVTLPAGTNLTGKSISATTTAIDSTTLSGFGSTSEFSLTKLASVSSLAPTDTSLASTGQNIQILAVFGLLITLGGGSLIVHKRMLQ